MNAYDGYQMIASLLTGGFLGGALMYAVMQGSAWREVKRAIRHARNKHRWRKA